MITRQLIVKLLNKRDFYGILYVHYLQGCKVKNYASLSPEMFMTLFRHWSTGDIIVIELIAHYINTFDIRELSRDNRIIKYI